jgi:hypothetical protein
MYEIRKNSVTIHREWCKSEVNLAGELESVVGKVRAGSLLFELIIQTTF